MQEIMLIYVIKREGKDLSLYDPNLLDMRLNSRGIAERVDLERMYRTNHQANYPPSVCIP